ncbi:hypothetical protein COO60DRAFT_752437 [Scenedesmus sp. NREL 46B-D3]|nr:hypothetical protein COO60DRAFT_752437 [Scenedesmus sp. NREL 46B-D3]
MSIHQCLCGGTCVSQRLQVTATNIPPDRGCSWCAPDTGAASLNVVLPRMYLRWVSVVCNRVLHQTLHASGWWAVKAQRSHADGARAASLATRSLSCAATCGLMRVLCTGKPLAARVWAVLAAVLPGPAGPGGHLILDHHHHHHHITHSSHSISAIGPAPHRGGKRREHCSRMFACIAHIPRLDKKSLILDVLPKLCMLCLLLCICTSATAQWVILLHTLLCSGKERATTLL